MGVNAFGTTAAEQHQGESLEQRMAQEEPDPAAASTTRSPTPTPWAATTPTRSRPTRTSWATPRSAATGAGRLVAPDEGSHEDAETDLIAGDVGIDGGAASAEEAAMHVVDEP